MSPVVILVGLLVLAYFGSMLVGGRAIRGFGLPSGTEFLLLGIFLGPQFMGVLGTAGLRSFEPLVIFGLTWLALVTGAHYGFIGERRVRGRRIGAGIALALISLAFTSGAAGAMAYLWTPFRGRELALLGLGIGLVSTETTRHAVRWVTERYEAKGPLSELIADVTEADDAVPLAGLALLFALLPQTTAVALPLPVWALVLVTLAAGGVMGATCAALFDVEPRMSQRWGIVLGSMLLAAGTSMRLGLAGMTATFVMGFVTARLSKSRVTLHRMLGTTERVVMLPVFVLAGAYVTLPKGVELAPIAAAAILARFASKLAAGRALALGVEPRPRATLSLGLGLLPAGILTMTVGLASLLRFPGPIGETILAVAALNAVLGEIIGPAMLRRSLRRAGELAETPSLAPKMQRPKRRRPDPRAAHRPRGQRGSLPGVDRPSDPHLKGGGA